MLSHVLIKQGGRGGGVKLLLLKVSPVCECVTETDICLTFYAELND